MFFDNGFHYVGDWTKSDAISASEFVLETNLHRVNLDGNGTLLFEVGNAFSAIMCSRLGTTQRDARSGIVARIGEFPLAEVTPCSFNGLVITSRLEVE
jgi:hypothetical protein